MVSSGGDIPCIPCVSVGRIESENRHAHRMVEASTTKAEGR